MSLRLLTCWYCGFECLQGHGCLSLVSVVCCQVGVSALGLSLAQRSLTNFGVSECDHDSSTLRRPCPSRAVVPW